MGLWKTLDGRATCCGLVEPVGERTPLLQYGGVRRRTRMVRSSALSFGAGACVEIRLRRVPIFPLPLTDNFVSLEPLVASCATRNGRRSLVSLEPARGSSRSHARSFSPPCASTVTPTSTTFAPCSLGGRSP